MPKHDRQHFTDGIDMDGKLSFTSHIDKVASLSYKVVGFITRNSGDFRNTSSFILLFNSFAGPLLELLPLNNRLSIRNILMLLKK